MTAFEDFVNLELPRRRALLTVAITGYDGDPNDGAAPAILQGAPVGTWYLRGDLNYYTKRTVAATGWVLANVDPRITVKEDLTFPIDYNDGTAVDPTAGLVLDTQSAIDSFLSDNGTSNFKHLQVVWDATPLINSFEVNFNLASGIHRPTGATVSGISWYLANKFNVGDGVWYINGALPSSYPALPGLGSISVDTITTGTNPSINFAGTPFTGQDLKGRYIVANTGQLMICHNNNDSQLFVLTDPSPAPTTVTVTSTPATILRNSLTDAVGSALNGTGVQLGNDTYLKNISVDPFGQPTSTALNIIGNFRNSANNNENVMIDMASYYEITGVANTAIQNGMVVFVDNFVSLLGFIYRPPPEAQDTNNFVYQVTSGGIFAFGGAGWYIRGSRLGAAIIGDGSFITAPNSVYDEIGQAAVTNNNGGLINVSGLESAISFSYFGSGKIPELRGFRVSNPLDNGCIALQNSARIDSSIVRIVATDNSMAIVRVSDRATLGGFRVDDGGSNTDVGIDIRGPFANVELDTDFAVAGTVGDVRDPDGIIRTYGSITSGGPFFFLDSATRLNRA